MSSIVHNEGVKDVDSSLKNSDSHCTRRTISYHHLQGLAFLGLCLGGPLILYAIWGGDGSFTSPIEDPTTDNHKHDFSSDIASKWHPPKKTDINDLDAVLDGSGVFGFVFDGSQTPSSLPYDTYNWCNMPHVRRQEYVRVSEDYKLEYVEVIHRHHKRTPYAANTFPHEVDTWSCDDEALFYYGAPGLDNAAAAINWQVYTSPANPLVSKGFRGSCQFPQITAGGLLDSRQHGEDLFGVYHDMLGFLPDDLDKSKISFRVTNNQITSQVAGQVVFGMWPASNHKVTKVLVQPPFIDSLEPGYSCSSASKLFSKFSTQGRNKNWLQHLRADQTRKLFSRLDAVSGIKSKDHEWHMWFDHYFDNLSARLCHQKPLPCNRDDPTLCVSQEDANAVFRRGEYEYSYIYRNTRELLEASVASYGIWVAELAANIRNVMQETDRIIYRHNIAHDGSISKLLSILQVDVMVWPGMGSEVVFELYSRESKWYLRVLWSGQVLTSSDPVLGSMDMLPAESFLNYIDDLVGIGAEKVVKMC